MLKDIIKDSGGQARIARKLGVAQQTISTWLRRKVPARHVIALEKATGGRVTRYELRPDLYPRE